ncbi:caspase domain-containing protein [Streptomyces sp. NPDC017524]|uniref:caspase domain-containing protein n=1 Tax=Streptomyces sp. NPDC017524 TaxID=3364999 RepID=UPI00378D211F
MAPVETEDISHGESHAVLIGVSTYQDPSFPAVPAALNSVRGMADALIDPELCGWPEDRVTIIENPENAAALAQQLRRIAEQTSDTLLVYFVGHGVISDLGDVCLAVCGTDLRDPDLTGLEYPKVRRIVMGSPAQVKIVILDCCYSGRAIQGLSAGGDGHFADATAVSGAYTLTASDGTAHVAPLAEQITAPTSFTRAFLDIVRQGIQDGPSALTLGDIYRELRPLVMARGLPAPNRRGTDTADLYTFARNIAFRPPGRSDERAGDLTVRLITTEAEELFIQLMEKQDPVALTHESLDALDDSPGVYQLHRSQGGPGSRVVYVGQSDRSLQQRLQAQMVKISGRLNIDVSEISFTRLYVEDDLSVVYPARLLINRLLDQGEDAPWRMNGFGNSDPGRNRDRTVLKSRHFDALYPINLAWVIRNDGPRGRMTALEFATLIKGKLPYVFRFAYQGSEIEAVSVEMPEGAISADEAFRLLAEALGAEWQISALSGYVVMYRERDVKYPSATRYYCGTRVWDSTPELYGA